MDAILSRGLAKGPWAKGRHIFTEVTKACEKAQLLYAGCAIYCGLSVLKLIW